LKYNNSLLVVIGLLIGLENDMTVRLGVCSSWGTQVGVISIISEDIQQGPIIAQEKPYGR